MGQTPLMKIWWLGNAVITMDSVGNLREVCMCVTPEDREWVVWSLGRLHKVPTGELRIPFSAVEEPRPDREEAKHKAEEEWRAAYP